MGTVSSNGASIGLVTINLAGITTWAAGSRVGLEVVVHSGLSPPQFRWPPRIIGGLSRGFATAGKRGTIRIEMGHLLPQSTPRKRASEAGLRYAYPWVNMGGPVGGRADIDVEYGRREVHRRTGVRDVHDAG